MEALKHGYTVLTLNNGASEEIERDGVQRFLDQHVDAVIFCAALNPRNVRLIAEAGVATVQIEHESAKVGSFSLVDPMSGLREAVEHLQGLDHSRIGYIGGLPGLRQMESRQDKSPEAERVNGFRRAMRSVGLGVPDEYIRLGPYYIERADRQPGRSLAQELLCLPVAPTALIVGSDLLAAGALQAVHDMGLGVPKDMSIIGYDDTMAEILTPPLTSIAQPIPELGRNAVTLALEAISDPGAGPRKIVVPTKLVIRRSTAAPPR